MAASGRNISALTIHQGPGDVWLIGAPPADSDTPQLTLTGGTPDDVAHPGSIHLGGIIEGVTVVPSAKVEEIRIDQYPAPIDAVVSEEEMRIETVLAQAQDVAKLREALASGRYTNPPAIADGPAADKEIAVGGATPEIGPVTFTGAGLNDAASSGAYTGTRNSIVEVKIDAEGTPDTFKWRRDGGAWTTGVAITGAAQTLTAGVKIAFAATTGHTSGDQWVIQIVVERPCVAVIAAKLSDPSLFNVQVLYRVKRLTVMELSLGRVKPMQAKVSFEALEDLDRTAGKRLGVVFETV